MSSTTTPRAVDTGTIARNARTMGTTMSVTAIATVRATVRATGVTASIATAVATLQATTDNRNPITVETANEIAADAGITDFVVKEASSNSDAQHCRRGVSAEPQTLSETDLGVWDLARPGVAPQL